MKAKQADKDFTKNNQKTLTAGQEIVETFDETAPQYIRHKKVAIGSNQGIELTFEGKQILVELNKDNKIESIKINDSNNAIYYGSNGGVIANNNKHTYQTPEASGFTDLKKDILTILDKLGYKDIT